MNFIGFLSSAVIASIVALMVLGAGIGAIDSAKESSKNLTQQVSKNLDAKHLLRSQGVKL